MAALSAMIVLTNAVHSIVIIPAAESVLKAIGVPDTSVPAAATLIRALEEKIYIKVELRMFEKGEKIVLGASTGWWCGAGVKLGWKYVRE